MENKILQFKITLNAVRPIVWRRIQVPDKYSFWDLHCAIQDAMGWVGYHLHAFTVWKIGTVIRPTRIQMPDPEWDYDGDLDESKEMLYAWFPNRFKQCTYEYDFGDGWTHTVLYEKTMFAEPGKKYPLCITGKNLCPPEDCGGPWGYMDLLKVINKPSSKEGRELREWMGLDKGEIYDPTVWSAEEVEFGDPKEELKEYLEWRE